MTTTIYHPEKNYPKNTPFTYLIGWTQLDKFYYGVRFAQDCHPDELWTKYFTSSRHVKKFRQENGDPDIITIDMTFTSAEDAREHEYTVLRDNNCVKSEKWLNKGNGGKDFCCFEQSEESKRKISEALKGRPKSAEHNQKNSDSNKRKPKSAEHKRKISDTKKNQFRNAQKL